MLYSELETPCVVIDETILEHNIRQFHRFAQQRGVRVRPHMKTHKLPYVAEKQRAAGITGITCQKIGEAEVFSAEGFKDILITFNIVGKTKLERLVALSETVSELGVVADSDIVLEDLSKAFAGRPREIDILIECDTGAHRCGVQTPRQAVQLAQKVISLPGLRLRGVMTYPSPYSEDAVQQWFSEAADLAERSGVAFEVYSSGGTPSMWELDKAPIVSEYRIGTYVYQDRSQIASGACTLQDCALTVLTTVVSVPEPGRVIIDAGSKALTSDLLGQDGYGYIKGHPDARVTALSEEHGILSFPNYDTHPRVGDRLEIVPNHACPVSNLFNEVHFVNGGDYAHSQFVSARGKVL
ncbi:MAG: D-TA family PLP-dependent enzyme [Saccharospirillum sp.]